MATTLNDVLPGPGAAPSGASPDASVDSSQAARRTDAVGAEIAVTVHASRYSATARGVGKNLPAVHEETRTVIVFPTGAVVRLSAGITTGEVVVLTNQQTGADVICRVANVKAQPGAQNYVNLEFTQRAPGFWGDHVQAERPVRAESTGLAAGQIISSLSAVSTPAPPFVELRPQTSRGAVSVPAAELISAVQAVTQLLGAPPVPAPAAAHDIEDDTENDEGALLEAPVIDIAPVRAITEPAPPVRAKLNEAQMQGRSSTSQSISVATPRLPAADPTTEPVAPVENILAKPAVTGVRMAARIASARNQQQEPAPQPAPVAQLTPEALPPPIIISTLNPAPQFSQSVEEKTPGRSKNIILVAAAAVVLLLIGGAAGALLFRHGSTSTAEVAAAPQQLAAPQQVATSPAVPTQSLSVTSVQPAAASAVLTAQPILPASAAVKPESEAPNAAPTPAVAARRPSIVVHKLAPPIAKAASQMVSAEPPPVITGNNFSGNLLDPTERAGGPVVPSLSGAQKGGQLQEPKLISSASAVYPKTARDARIQGVVVIDALIDTSGNVSAMKPISGSSFLQPSAMGALSTWKYAPARLNGQPIPMHIRVNIEFHLQ
jgi:protein TonB